MVETVGGSKSGSEEVVVVVVETDDDDTRLARSSTVEAQAGVGGNRLVLSHGSQVA